MDLTRSIPSPCCNVCKLDDEFVCKGCLRTREEIVNWKTMSDEQKMKVWSRILIHGGVDPVAK